MISLMMSSLMNRLTWSHTTYKSLMIINKRWMIEGLVGKQTTSIELQERMDLDWIRKLWKHSQEGIYKEKFNIYITNSTWWRKQSLNDYVYHNNKLRNYLDEIIVMNRFIIVKGRINSLNFIWGLKGTSNKCFKATSNP